MSQRRHEGYKLRRHEARQRVDAELKFGLLMVEDVEGQVAEVTRNDQVSLRYTR